MKSSIALLSFLLLSSSASADLIMKEYCYKMPKALGGDTARIRARFLVEKDKQDTDMSVVYDLLTVEALEGKIFEGAKGNAEPETSADFKASFAGTIRLAEGKEVLLKDLTLVEAVRFVAVRRALGDSNYIDTYNKMVRAETGIDPSKPVLQIIELQAPESQAVKLHLAGRECAPRKK